MTPRIAISVGDVNGIGPEVVYKALSSGVTNFVPVLVGSEETLNSEMFQGLATQGALTCEVEVVNATGLLGQPGKISGDSGALSMRCVQRAVELCLEGRADGMVTAPISKEAIHLGGYNYPGHTEFIAELVGSSNPLMMMVSDRLRVALVTGHVPVSGIADLIQPHLIKKKLEAVTASLMGDFAIERPRVAVLGLNPHAGDGGVLGSEEASIIRPAISSWSGMAQIDGPFPADAFFARAGYERYDAVLAMYHDQGLVPFKTLAAGHGVNFTAGLPIVRTSPDHGTAFDIAGKNLADESSMVAALTLAVNISKNRSATS